MATEIKWTDEQESAINYPSDSSACVSAAAGSGKTALLVERVVRLRIFLRSAPISSL